MFKTTFFWQMWIQAIEYGINDMYDTKEVMLILYSFTPTRSLWYEFSNNSWKRDFGKIFVRKKAGLGRLGKHSYLKYALECISN